MALLLRVAKKSRATAAMALVGGRGVASSAVDSAAGRALATLDHVPKVIKFAALPPAAVDRQDAGAKPGVEKAKGSAFRCDGAPGRAAVARDQVPGAQPLGLGLKPGLAQILAPSGKLKLGAGGGVARRTYGTRGGWPCQAPPEALKEMEDAFRAQMKITEDAIKAHTAECLSSKKLLKAPRPLYQVFLVCVFVLAAVSILVIGFFDYALTVGEMTVVNFLNGKEFKAVKTDFMDEAEATLLDLAQQERVREVRNRYVQEAWTESMGCLIRALTLKSYRDSWFRTKEEDSNNSTTVATPSAK
ncbi:hypothetical protein OsI_24810 [Oryza sativa Indica Group]|nr:hypothetical protein OsI_24810 [Oryza sativa Indica Group]